MGINNIKTACLYLRYSDRSQSEQSIEGQMRVCKDFCERNKIQVVDTFIDRAISARSTEKREEFLRMLRCSDKHPWDAVVVYKLDRFARNRYDSAVSKFKLKKNGVRLISATENLTDSPETIVLESVLEGMAEYYSVELSQKITRGIRETALKCNNTGGQVPLGYKIENHKLVVNPDTAALVKEAFQLYASGMTVADICRRFNDRGYKTSKNTAFNRNSFKAMFQNERYIGVYQYRDIRIENGLPAIIDKDLFSEVAKRLKISGAAPGRGKAQVDYLLSGKIFCGHCGTPMNGESGTGRHDVVYNYYTCYNHKRTRKCDKRPVKKEFIETVVAQDAMALLTDDVIEEIADIAVRQTEKDLQENTRIPELTARKTEVTKGIANITKTIEKGIDSDALLTRLGELEKERKEIERLLIDEEQYVYRIEREHVIAWLCLFQQGDIADEKFKKRLIDLMVNSVTVYDEPDGLKITTAYNLTSCAAKTFRVSVKAGIAVADDSFVRSNRPPR